MKAHKFIVSGKWGHFRRPEANNNPITYDFMPKTAFIGMIGAIVGLSRDEMKKKYKSLCQNIFYNVEILNPILKFATNFRIYKYKGSLSNVENPPQFYEILQNPKYRISIIGDDDVFDGFIKMLKTNKSIYNPTLGLANCPLDIEYLSEFDLKKVKNQEITTKGFVPFECKPKINAEVSLSYDSIPLVQNNDWFNIEYKKVFYGYVPEGQSISVSKSDYEHQYISDGLGYFFI